MLMVINKCCSPSIGAVVCIPFPLMVTGGVFGFLTAFTEGDGLPNPSEANNASVAKMASIRIISMWI
jgi:hypothetical protein